MEFASAQTDQDSQQHFQILPLLSLSLSLSLDRDTFQYYVGEYEEKQTMRQDWLTLEQERINTSQNRHQNRKVSPKNGMN